MELCCTSSHQYLDRFWSKVCNEHFEETLELTVSLRTLSDEEKFKVYVRIVRLFLEDDDSVQAETYYNRAASLSGSASSSDRETSLAYKLCQARINDFQRKFLEAASRYHELSWIGDIDEEDRTHML